MKKQFQHTLQSQNLSKNITHFMRKAPKCQNTIQLSQKQRSEKKDPLSFPKSRLQVHQKMVGILKKMKIPRNLPKFQVIQPYLTSRA